MKNYVRSEHSNNNELEDKAMPQVRTKHHTPNLHKNENPKPQIDQKIKLGKN